MNGLGFILLTTLCLAAFVWASRAARRAMPRRAAWRLSACLLVLLVLGAGLRYLPELEARWLPVASYAPIRPWYPVVLALGFLGSAIPQLSQRRLRVVLTGFSLALFLFVMERAAATLATTRADFRGRPHTETGVCEQTTGFSCGAAAAATLLTQLGLAADEAEMAERCATNCFLGTDEIGLLKGLRERLAEHFDVRLERVAPEDLTSANLPALAAIDLTPFVGHWIVILEYDGERLTIADPLRAAPDDPTGGIRRLTLEEFAASYQGLLIQAVRDESDWI